MIGRRSRLCWRSSSVASSWLMPTCPVMSGIGVMTSRTRVWPHSATGVKRRSRLVTMPSRWSPVVDDRQARDAVAAADLVELLEGGVRADGDRVGDHAGLGALDEVDLVGLVLDRQVAVQDADAAVPGHRDRHPRLGDGVHGGRDERHPDRDLAGQPGRGVDLAGDDVGLAGLQQHVVVGQPQLGERGGRRRLGRGRGDGRRAPRAARHRRGRSSWVVLVSSSPRLIARFYGVARRARHGPRAVARQAPGQRERPGRARDLRNPWRAKPRSGAAVRAVRSALLTNSLPKNCPPCTNPLLP